MSFELAKAYAQRLLAEPGGGSYQLAPPRRENVEILPGTLYRFMTWGGPENRAVTLSLFLGIGGLGGALWEQEMRTLERLGGFEHPALPQFLDGGRLDGLEGDAGAAYVRTFLDGKPAIDEDFARVVAADRSQVLPHLWHLADALGLLHASNVSHRGLWPGALLVQPPKRGSPYEIGAIKLARFEMSALLANLFNSRENGATYEQLRVSYLAEDGRSLLYTPPERLRFVLARPDGELGAPPGDVFSLGMIAAEWLVTGPSPAVPPSSYDEILSYQQEVRRRVNVHARDLPGQLIEMLHGMLDPRPDARPSAYEVAQAFAQSYADAQQLLAGDVPELPFLVVYMAEESDKILLNQWKLIEDSATTEAGKVQLTELIESDMRGAEILHSPAGAEGFARDEAHKLRRATTVVIGSQVTWFCELFWTPKPGGGTRLFEELLLIKYVRRTEDISHQLGRLRVTGLVRRVPMVEAQPAPMNNELVAEIISSDRPAWSTLVDRAESSRTQTPAERDYLDSLEWYIQYQRAMLEARTYLFQVAPGEGGSDRVHLRWDSEADRTRPAGGQPLTQSAILDTARPDMAVFVSNADDGLDRGRVQLVPEASQDWASAETYDVVDVIEPDIVVVSARGKRRPPDRGWLRMSVDSGTPPQIARQADALVELSGNRVLLRRLLTPQEEFRPSERWAKAGGDLLGDGRDAVRAILEHEGIFALQGPPGTGKTEVTSQAVVDYLKRDAGARVLVSAQSHDALENLALRITRKLGITVPAGSGRAPTLDRLAIRVRTRNYDSHPELAGLQPAHLAESVAQYSVRKSQQWLASERAQFPGLVSVVQHWIDRAPKSLLELDRRVRTAANLVFATTGAATKRNLFVEATQEPFDWVVIEEAGRAWPTELALPMVRGVRWTLVGDHAQIGAFSRADVERFLESLAGYQNEELMGMYKARQRHAENFGTFARFFRDKGKGPTRVLSEQYRMDSSISSLVGDTFYASSGGLATMREPAPQPLDAPGILGDSRMVWIDTGFSERSRFDGSWANEYEATICSDLVRSMRPAPGQPGGPSLAILTPYRDQVEALEERISEHADKVFTVDRFQGREADVVVASLVRDRVRPTASPASTVGFVADPARINVLLSRARELLVIVGRFDLFAHHAGPQWEAIAERFMSDPQARVVKAEQLRGL
ncbi:AAA domain-containing protein [Nocardioides sp. T2.26MG-1]|uniref:AAA domain-containing protein n=1 Tax=Nocardioides sp. T2.26MG-1 TaxID=3041166 RepID=UPI002477B36C|nr:AAA domain-containing protein [Nocardioides sp. T2.26MG-1]CAI9413157.1 hypothetical protein HIDPHFAB_01950 [Nocardioides sp. T2.26MG-1]